VKMLTEERTYCNHYCNKCSKRRPILRTQARRCRLHSSVASSTTVKPDCTQSRDAAAVGLSKVSKIIQNGLCLSFCCKFFHGSISSKSSDLYRF